MKTLLSFTVFLLFVSCSTSKQGKVIQGKDGKIESGVIKPKCTPPQKSYAKEIEAKLKAEMDSLKSTPSATFDATFNQKVVKLREYSSSGLDVDLLTFRICEMANNRGMTAQETKSLIEKAIELWKNQDNNGVSLSQVVNSYNQTGGITAGIVVVPEDQDIPLESNFTVSEISNSPEFRYEIKPRQGEWSETFFAYPFNEDSLVDGRISPKLPLAFMSSFGDIYFIVNQKEIKTRFISCSQTPANSNSGYIFSCKVKPSLLFFGDFTNPKKQYCIKL